MKTLQCDDALADMITYQAGKEQITVPQLLSRMFGFYSFEWRDRDEIIKGNEELERVNTKKWSDVKNAVRDYMEASGLDFTEKRIQFLYDSIVWEIDNKVASVEKARKLMEKIQWRLYGKRNICPCGCKLDGVDCDCTPMSCTHENGGNARLVIKQIND